MNVWLCHVGYEEGHYTPAAFFDRQRAIDWVHDMKIKLKKLKEIEEKYKDIEDTEEKWDKMYAEKDQFCRENGIRDTLYKHAWYELIDVQ